ncbi:hypothetical protein E2C01_039853 [Portunus trituberculatus]|uniref:Uncharacterized protein n=1 Tax=Portunus trituberculatus TaxID=210409 RepID=A0A5B7FP56_PORTR|nr:hypothetical protein [Portunus trituberculatus]
MIGATEAVKTSTLMRHVYRVIGDTTQLDLTPRPCFTPHSTALRTQTLTDPYQAETKRQRTTKYKDNFNTCSPKNTRHSHDNQNKSQYGAAGKGDEAKNNNSQNKTHFTIGPQVFLAARE